MPMPIDRLKNPPVFDAVSAGGAFHIHVILITITIIITVTIYIVMIYQRMVVKVIMVILQRVGPVTVMRQRPAAGQRRMWK